MPKPFTAPGSYEVKYSLGKRLIKTVDRGRDIITRYGFRQYEVRLVHTRWSGGARGVGSEYITSVQVIEPTPRITDLSALATPVTPVGWTEVGSIIISRISGTYTSDQLRGLDEDGNPPGPDEGFFYEIENPRRGWPNDKRRFYPSTAPYWDAVRFEWRITVARQDEDRSREGELP